MMRNWFHKPSPNAICPYCFGLVTLAPGEKMTCGFCESELMRAMNFFIPVEDFFAEHSEQDLRQRLAWVQSELKTERRKIQRFYLKDQMKSIKAVLKLRARLYPLL